MHIDQWLEHIPAIAVYLLVAGVVCIESLGIPLPGEIVLVSAALLTSTHSLDVSPVWIGVAGSAGAIIGDSIGYAIGRRWGGPLFDWLGRKFPSHFGPAHVAYAERFFKRWGVLAVFVGRFIALLRIFAGPLSGSLEMPYPRFLAANAAGGICWAGGLTAAIYFLGEVADKWFSRFSYIALIVAALGGIVIGLLIKRRTSRAAEQHHAEMQAEAAADAAEAEPATDDAPSTDTANPATEPVTDAAADTETDIRPGAGTRSESPPDANPKAEPRADASTKAEVRSDAN